MPLKRGAPTLPIATRGALSRREAGIGAADRRERIGPDAIRGMKRAFDIFVASIALVLLAPVMAIVALLVRAILGKPVLFRQIRPGLHGEPFEIIKFRSMFDAYDSAGNEIPEAELDRFRKVTYEKVFPTVIKNKDLGPNTKELIDMTIWAQE